MISRKFGDEHIHFEDLDVVRRAAGLPADFTLGSIVDYTPPVRPLWESEESIGHYKKRLLTSLPADPAPHSLPDVADRLAAVLRAELVNTSQSLPGESGGLSAASLAEIDTVVLDFRDLLMPGIYALIDHLVGQRSLQHASDYVNQFLDDTAFWGGEPHQVAGVDEQPRFVVVAYDHFGPFGFKVMPLNGDGEPQLAADLSLSDPAGQPLQELAAAVLSQLFAYEL